MNSLIHGRVNFDEMRKAYEGVPVPDLPSLFSQALQSYGGMPSDGGPVEDLNYIGRADKLFIEPTLSKTLTEVRQAVKNRDGESIFYFTYNSMDLIRSDSFDGFLYNNANQELMKIHFEKLDRFLKKACCSCLHLSCFCCGNVSFKVHISSRERNVGYLKILDYVCCPIGSIWNEQTQSKFKVSLNPCTCTQQSEFPIVRCFYMFYFLILSFFYVNRKIHQSR